MDEAGVRTLLSRVADTEPPPPRIDLAAAISAGRRGRWWRRARAGVVALAAAGAVAAALLVAPGQQPGHQGAGGMVVPARFNVLVPYASFGWLPPGFQAGGAPATSASTPVQLRLVAASRTALIPLTVYPAGACHLAGQTLACSISNATSPVQSRAPDVHGHRAYWLKWAQLAWEYAPGAWSVLDWTDANAPWPPAGAQRAAVLRVAAGVRYAQRVPVRFPYWISGLPAAWQVSEVDYTMLADQPVAQELQLDDHPGDSGNYARTDVDEIQITTLAAHSGGSCPGRITQHITVGGVAAVLADWAGTPEPQLCVPDWRGLQVEVILAVRQNAPVPDPTGAHGVLAYARLLHPLGPGPAHWTTNLLR